MADYLKDSRKNDKSMMKKPRVAAALLKRADRLLQRTTFEEKLLEKNVRNHKTLLKEDYGIVRGKSRLFNLVPGTEAVEAMEEVDIYIYRICTFY